MSPNDIESQLLYQIVHDVQSPSAYPFVKWAGGKTHLLSKINAFIPSSFRRYYEPFLGGGALFFWLNSSGIRFEAHLSDINAELINTYKIVKSRVEDLIEVLKIYEKEYRQNPLFYYQLRDSAEYSFRNDYVKRAAKFITLNRTCYNGLYRVNSQGKFNVPMGRYKNPTICNSNNLRNVSYSLRQSEANISVRDYKELLYNKMGEGDFIYLDPPYSPTSRTSSFTGYTNNGFKDKDQEELANIFKKLDKQGCKVLLSNSDAALVKELYSGYSSGIVEIHALRSINSKATKRSGHKELLIRNYSL